MIENIDNNTFLCNGNPGIIYNGHYVVFLPNKMEIVEITREEYNRGKCLEINSLRPLKSTFQSNLARLRLIVTKDCNLRCKYCFARGGEDNIYLNPLIAKKGLDELIKKDTKYLNIDFFGGEPTLNKDCIKEVVKYSKKKNLRTMFSITSNGVMDRDILDFMIKNKFIFKISLDGFKDYHNKMRPMASGEGSYKRVLETIKRLNMNGSILSLRVTVTQENVKDMPKIVEKYREFNLGYIHFEPMHIEGRGEIFEKLKPSIKDYVDNFGKSLDIGKKLGISITSSSLLNLYKPCAIFCSSFQGNNIIITPEGYITTCLGVQDYKHNFSSYFIVGKYSEEEKRFIYDKSKIEKIKREIDVNRNERCKNCFAKYICSGSCVLKNKLSGGFDYYGCQINKQLIYDAIRRIWINSVEPSQ